MLVFGVLLLIASPFSGWEVSKLTGNPDIAVLTGLIMAICGAILAILSLTNRIGDSPE